MFYKIKKDAQVSAFLFVEEEIPNKKDAPNERLFYSEKKRFELLNRFWRLRDFQSRALDQLGDFSVQCWTVFITALILYHTVTVNVNTYFRKKTLN